MSYELPSGAGETRRIAGRDHKVIIEGRKRAAISSVEDVDSFNENEIIFLTSMGMMTVLGEDLHIAKLNLEEGQLVIEGSIQSLDYADHEEERLKRKGVFSRVFK